MIYEENKYIQNIKYTKKITYFSCWYVYLFNSFGENIILIKKKRDAQGEIWILQN